MSATTIPEQLEQAIVHITERLRGEWDSVRIEQLANALQSVTYARWQLEQPLQYADSLLTLHRRIDLIESKDPSS